MTSIIEYDRPPAPRSRRPVRHGRRILVALTATAGAFLVTVATGAAFVLSHQGNRPLPAGVHTVEIYTVDEALSRPVPPAEQPGVIGRFLAMCDTDSYYIVVAGAGQCVVLNGPLGTVPATGTTAGAALGAGQAAQIRAIVQAENRSSTPPVTRVLLGYDGGWAGLIGAADLNAGGPITAGAVG